ncbi:MAG: YdcF family protein [Candidatus Paceibacterota bacterium]
MGDRYDLIAVFGGGYSSESSNEPGIDTIARLKKAKEVWEENEWTSIFVSAGLHHPDPDRDRVLAADMKRWLQEQKIPENFIYTEEESYDTYTGVVSLLYLIDGHNFENICLVSNELHLKRIRSMIAGARLVRPWLWDNKVEFSLVSSSRSSKVDSRWVEYRSWAISFLIFILPFARRFKRWRKTRKHPYEHLR